jgi:PAS domain S-box-containing protein
MKQAWRPLAIIGLLLGLLVFLLLRSASPDLALRRTMLEQLGMLALRDAELTRDAMLTRGGLLPNYDALMHDTQLLRAALDSLAAASRSGSDAAAARLRPAVERLREALTEKLSDVEDFKSDDALLRTSASYLTYSISRLAEGSGTHRAMASEVGTLSTTFLRFAQSPEPGTGEAFKAALLRLAKADETDEVLRNVVAHGSLVADRLPQVVGMLRAVARAPTGTALGEMLTAIERTSAEAEANAQVYRYLQFLAALLLLTYLVGQFAQLRRSANALRRSNVELSHEITERIDAETALRASEERYRAIAESAQDAIISVDAQGRIFGWNPGAQAIFGHGPEEILDTPLQQLILPWRPEDCVEKGATFEATGVRNDGAHFPVEASQGRWSSEQGASATIIARDVSERKRLEETARQQELKLVQANKLAALGTLVSGVAHEINNPNQMVLLNASVLIDTWRDACASLDILHQEDSGMTLAGLPYSEMRDAASTLISDIRDSARRIDRIVQDLKDFARPQRSSSRALVDVNEVARRAVRLLNHLIQRRCRDFQAAWTEGLPVVRGDAQQLEQVFVNLIVNALEALSDPSCTVRVSSRHNEAGDGVVIEVADHGVGIAPEHLQRLCDPFFTTKQDSGGTGLGLSVTFSLVQAHGGRLDFDSALGHGTRAIVTLPVADKDAAEAA